MEQNQSLAAGDSGAPEDESGSQSSAKRPRTLTAKALDLESGEKLPQMVINNDLLVLIAKVIQADPDSWGLLLTKNHGKATVANKLVKFLSNLPNPLTQGKSATAATVAVWMKRGKDLAEVETERRAAGNASGRGAAAGSVP